MTDEEDFGREARSRSEMATITLDQEWVERMAVTMTVRWEPDPEPPEEPCEIPL